jgi:transposase InsO family protein
MADRKGESRIDSWVAFTPEYCRSRPGRAAFEARHQGQQADRAEVHALRPRASRWRPEWATFVKKHADDIWCCDFVQTYDLFFRPLFLLFLMNQRSRKVVHLAAKRTPTQEWTAQQLRNATMDGLGPRLLIRDRDEKFGAAFDRVAKGMGTRVIKTAVQASNMNPVGERFVGSLRRESLDHVLLLGELQLEDVAQKYVIYFNKARPHQGIGQRIPDCSGERQPGRHDRRHSGARGLHHDYRRAA